MARKTKILLLEDSSTDAELIQRLLIKEIPGAEFHVAVNKETCLQALDQFEPDIILSDNSLPQFNATEALRITRQRLMNIPFILVTGTVSDEFAANIMKSGADDYILKDRLIRLPAAIDTALKQRKAEREKQAAIENLKLSEENYRKLIERVSDAFIALDTDWKFIYVNKKAGQVFGRDPDQLIGKNIWTEFPEGIGQSFYKAFHDSLELQARIHLEIYSEVFDKWFENHIYSSPSGISVYFRDITERKKAEEDLRQSELRLNEAQAITHISNWEIDLLHNINIWSDELYRIFGVNKTDLSPSPDAFLSFMHPDDLDFAQKKIQEAFVTFHNSSFTFRFLRKDGMTRHGHTEWRFEFNKNGNPVRLFGIFQDITERVEAEEEIRKSNERFQYATKATSDIIWELNFETKEYLVHEEKEKLYGAPNVVDWTIGTQGEYIIEEDREKVRLSFREARMDPARDLWKYEYRVYGKENSVLFVINHAIFIRNEKGNAIRAVGAITDLTEKKKLEAELLEQQRKIQLKIMATSLAAQEKERTAIGQELHDNVNQILVAAKMMLSLTKKTPEKTEEFINNTMNYLKQAIEENRKIAHVFVSPDLESGTLINQMKNLVNSMLTPTGLETNVIADELREELLDTDRKINIYRIAQEQCTNIIKYSNATVVHITMMTLADHFKMTVADNGVGADKSKTTNGIGLRNINGRLSVFNGSSNIITAPGKGFTLEVSIPLRE